MDKYADWYLAEYNRLHITGMQEQEKLRIMRSTEKQVSDAICGNDRGGYITIVPQYQDWNRRMSQLQVASPSSRSYSQRTISWIQPQAIPR